MKTKTKAAAAIAPIIVLPTLSDPKLLAELRAAGYVPVCCDDPSKVAVIMPHSKMFADDLLMSALYGMSDSMSSTERSRTILELHRRLLSNESKKP